MLQPTNQASLIGFVVVAAAAKAADAASAVVGASRRLLGQQLDELVSGYLINLPAKSFDFGL